MGDELHHSGWNACSRYVCVRVCACCTCRHSCGGTYMYVCSSHNVIYYYNYPQCSWVHGVLTNHDMSSLSPASSPFSSTIPFCYIFFFKAALVMPPRRGTVSSFPPLCPPGSTLSTLALTPELPPYTRCTCLPMCSVILKCAIYQQ